MSRHHILHADRRHYGWSNAFAPALTIAPGDTVELHPPEASDGQITRTSTVADVLRFDDTRSNPLVGPIAVDGAMPGDALKINILDIGAGGWGWTANFPGFGLLADQFRDPALHHWSFDPYALVPAAYGPGGRVPLKPHIGTIGLAPAAPGHHSVTPPRRVGGNLDVRDLAAGATLYLPVDVAGGLLSAGDTDAAQGDGEVCGTALEAPCSFTLRIERVPSLHLKAPRFTTPEPVARHLDWCGYDVTTGISPDLFIAAREAVSGMIDWLGREHHMSAIDAYLLCSVCGDLRISQIVDQPNWTVSCYFPRVVFQ